MHAIIILLIYFQEMYGDFIDELINPDLLKPFDRVFELQLPLRNAKLKFHSKVNRSIYGIYTHHTQHMPNAYNGMRIV